MYSGNGDNQGTTQERTDRCSVACKNKKTALELGPWSSRGDAVGFGLTENNGRCFCQHEERATCTRQHTSYKAYEYDLPAAIAFNIENPSEDKRTYSSRYSATTTESMLDSGVFAQSWRSSTATVNQWMQIDLGTVKSVFGVVTQGQIKYNYWVKSFTVSTSTSGNTWLPVNNAEIFYGNTDKSSSVRNDFTLVAARYVRIYAQTWNSRIIMRAGVVVTTGTPPSIPSRSYSILALATD